MKRYKLLLIILLIVGCDKDPTASTDCAGVVGGSAVEDCLVGSWKSTESKITYNLEGTIHISTEYEYYLYVFNSDGTGNYTSSQTYDDNEGSFMIKYYTGTWMINNNQLVYEGQNVITDQSIVSNWYFNLNEEILIFYLSENLIILYLLPIIDGLLFF